ncbi:neutral zinc metallopeptidase [Dermacoccaceae bacterium W4C1]
MTEVSPVTFNDNAQLDTSQVGSGGGGGGGGGGFSGLPGGVGVGGVGGLIIMILMVLFGGNLTGGSGGTTSYDTSEVGAAGQGSSQVDDQIAQCKTGADANDNVTCRVIGTVNSVQDYWATALPKHGTDYTDAQTILYSGQTQTACGTGSSQMGPFYCPLDRKAYIDVSFFNELTSKYGADDGSLAQMYVVAHEYGHHIQNLTGVLGRAQQDSQGADSGAVRVELQADCYAGVWVKHASETKDSQGQTLIKPVTQTQINSALSAASAVGDDRIQQKAQGRVTPESWTHGSSEQRQRWFMAGYNGGDMNSCDTFNASTL